MLFRSSSTYAHQIGTVIAYTTSMQNVGAHPETILQSPAVELIKSIPVDWDQTVVLQSSKIGSVLAFARCKGTEWFVCVLNGDTSAAKTVNVPLSFIGNEMCTATIVKDNMNNAQAVVMESRRVSAAETLVAEMGPGGGWVARIQRNTNGPGKWRY